ncbi:MAG TPA: CBS domain-containing protein [Methanoregulaceae archaeon]|nr:CBS domain-containing protein [Methanoregulaceae archaeon]
MSENVVIRDVMAKPVTIAKSAAITEALDKMLTESVDPLIVVNNNTVVGTISRRTIAESLGSKKNSSLSPSSIHVANSLEEDFTTVYPDQDIDVLVPLLQHYKLVVVYDNEHRLIGQVTAENLLKVCQPDGNLQDLLEPAWTIDIEERVVHMRRRMMDDRIHRFIVTENDKVIGIVTETDVAKAMRKFRKVVEDRHQDHRIRNLLVRDIMSTSLISVGSDVKISHAVDLMVQKNISTVPVIENGALKGLITRNSLIKAL